MISLITGENSTTFTMVEVGPDLTKLDKEKLYPYLTSGYVADRWWDLPSRNRRILAQNIIDWWSVPFKVGRYKYPYNGGWRERRADCSIGVVARMSIIGDWETICTRGEYYLASWEGHADWYEFGDRSCFYLPCYIVKVQGYGFNHGICGLQLDKDMTIFDNWLFFQYDNGNIRPGDWQMPIELEGVRTFVSIERTTKKLKANSMNYETITEWEL